METEDSNAGGGEEPVRIEIEDSFDLHPFHPSELIAMLDAYLDAAREAGLREVRLIHGRGKGVQRARVGRFLAGDSRVARFEQAPPGRGGWGATIAWLCDPRDEAATAAGAAERDDRRPTASNLEQSVFIGDVHGCVDELDELLEHLRGQLQDRFTLYLPGDLINRGPCSLRALTRIREYVNAGRAHYVLGNHEITFLRVAFEVSAPRPHDTFQDVLESADRDDWVEWLRRRPLAIDGEVGGRAFAMVHASVHPNWSLAQLRQQAGRVERCLGAEERDLAVALLAGDARLSDESDILGRITCARSVSHEGEGWSSRPPERPECAWHAQWARRRHDYAVVYGHWSRQGLHLAPGLRGLDTGCVHHGRDHVGYLTAWLPRRDDEADGWVAFGESDDRIWQVRARKRYYRD